MEGCVSGSAHCYLHVDHASYPLTSAEFPPLPVYPWPSSALIAVDFCFSSGNDFEIVGKAIKVNWEVELKHLGN